MKTKIESETSLQTNFERDNKEGLLFVKDKITIEFFGYPELGYIGKGIEDDIYEIDTDEYKIHLKLLDPGCKIIKFECK